MSLTIPEAVLVYHRNALFYSWQALEKQQELSADPEIREGLDRINNILFSAWLMFRDTSKSICILTTTEQTAKEGKNEL